MTFSCSAVPEHELARAVADYYAARAAEHDLVSGYCDPEVEPLRAAAKARYQELFLGLDVLEIACGTGYWTEVVAQVARTVLATDVCEQMLASARQRLAGFGNVRFQVADAYSLEGVPSGFNGAFAVWWWSHVPKRLLPQFLATLHSKLRPGARVLFVDQVPGAYEPKGQRVDAGGDTTEERVVSDGLVFRIVKNFPTCDEVLAALGGVATDIEFREFPDEKSWNVSYLVAG
jgi:protein-L-isoaspartate O-methyltransferase